jgi:hypothetical protein
VLSGVRSRQGRGDKQQQGKQTQAANSCVDASVFAFFAFFGIFGIFGIFYDMHADLQDEKKCQFR